MNHNQKPCNYGGFELCAAYCSEDVRLCTELTEPAIVLNSFERIRQERQAYKDMLDFDHMTGLLSKRAFYELGDEQLLQAKVTQQNYGLVAFDINNFKKFNDQLGHVKGDQVLMQLGEALRENTRQDDLLSARFGGDEFMFLCNLQPRSEDHFLLAEERLASIAKRLEGLVNYTLKHHAQYLTAAFGFELWDGEKDLSALIEGADKAMYIAKKKQKNTFVD